MYYKIKYNSITLDGIELRNDKYLFSLSNIFDYDKTYSSSEVLNDGQVYSNSKIEPKKIMLNGYIKGGLSDFLTLNKLLNKKDVLDLKVDIEGFGTLEAKVLITSKATNDDGVKALSCELIAFDPHLYGNKSVAELGIELYQGLTFPMTFPISWNGASHKLVNVYNGGNTHTYPVITVKGPCSNIMITNNTTGEAIWLDITLNQNDVLVIDNTESNRGIYLNGKRVIELKKGNWLKCIEGINNFSAYFQTNSNDKLVKIEMTERFI